MELSEDEHAYYGRQLKLEGFGLKAQSTLKNSKVGIVGMGGLGCPLAENLISTGVGELRIMDFDTVEIHNLHRQSLFSTSDLGKEKVTQAKLRLEARNPHSEIIAYHRPFDKGSADEFCNGLDLLIDASDNADTRIMLSDYAYLQRLSLISCALYEWEALLYYFKHKNIQSTNFRDLFPEGLRNESIQHCADTGVLPILCNLMASKMARKAVFHLIDHNTQEEGSFEHYSLKNDQQSLFKIKANSKNPLRNFGNAEHLALSYEEVQEKLTTESLDIVDVRSPAEFEHYNIGGQNIPLPELQTQFHALSDCTPVFVCESGIRSAAALSAYRSKYPENRAYHLFLGLRVLKHLSNA